MKNLSSFILGAALVSVSFASIQSAHAERRKNSLPEDVAVRHRRLLVKNRFEVTPLFESTISGEFQHIVGGGLKLEYHLSDMLSIGGVGVGSTQFNTKLTDRIVPTLEQTPDDMTREPLLSGGSLLGFWSAGIISPPGPPGRGLPGDGSLHTLAGQSLLSCANDTPAWK
jgi:hypothetical protein